jgi:hypothetical protein
MQSFGKRPGEKYPIAVEFKDRLPPGQTLSSATASATVVATGATASSTVLESTTGSIVGTQALITVQAGTHGVNYELVVNAVLSGGGDLEEAVQMVVDNKA